MVSRRCPNDACVIPFVAAHREWPLPVVRFFWCRYCMEMFAYVGDNELGGRYAASFARDPDSGEWRVWKPGKSERDVDLAVRAIGQVQSLMGVGTD